MSRQMMDDDKDFGRTPDLNADAPGRRAGLRDHEVEIPPVGAQQLGTERSGLDEQMLRPGTNAERVDVRVLEQQQPVVGVGAGSPQGALQSMGIAVGDPLAEPAQAQGAPPH